jgi:hypothetical protein
MLCASGTLKDDYAKKQQLSKEALYAAYYRGGEKGDAKRKRYK